MRIFVPICALLLALMFLPCDSAAQSPQDNQTVSVRELSIPRKAVREFDKGLECLAKKDAAGSLAHFQRATEEYPGYYEAYDRIGVADLQLWRIPDAEQAFRRAIEVSAAQYAHPLLALGAILDDREKFDEAETVIRKGLALQPGSWTGHYYLALALFGLGRLGDAEQSVHDSLHWKGDFPQAYLLLAGIHSRKRDDHSLLEDLNEYLKLAPDGPASARVKALREATARKISESEGDTDLALTQH